MIIDLKQEVKESRDLRFLEALLGALVGQRCLKAELSYGGELMLHVGDPVPYAHPKLADEQKGTWILGTRASWWSLLLNDPPFLIESNGLDPGPPEPTLTPDDVEKKARQLIGSTVVLAEPDLHPVRGALHRGIALFVEFSNRSRLAVVPNGEADEENSLADWELFTPYHMYLTCGLGPVWSYLRSDMVTPAASPGGAPGT
jgi:hypothetical protein